MALSKSTVLVVDDTAVNLKVMATFLSHAGYKALVAEDGAMALELARSRQPDLILLDIMMPGIDGFETCQALRKNPATRDIPVIFLTARSQPKDIVRGFQAGGVDYIIKPYQEEEVLARLNTHLTLARQRLELERMLGERESFLRMAAHDLRNPLAVISGWVQLLLSDSQPANTQRALQQMRLGCNQIQALLEDFLALQVIDGNQAYPAKTKLDLKAVISIVAEQQSLAAQKKNIRLEIPAQPECAPAYGILSQVHQILTNYTSNAVKYSPANTTVILAVLPIENHWRVEVRDQGPGVAPGERDKLFIEFARISNKPTAGETSTGLGLAIVRRLAGLQGGDAGAEFPDSGGSIFWFTLPQWKDQTEHRFLTGELLADQVTSNPPNPVTARGH